MKDYWLDELFLINNRTYSTGFYFGNQDEVTPNYNDSKPEILQKLIGKIIGKNDDNSYRVIVRNRFFKNDDVRIFSSQKGPSFHDTIIKISDLRGSELDVAQPNMNIDLTLNGKYLINDLIRTIPG